MSGTVIAVEDLEKDLELKEAEGLYASEDSEEWNPPGKEVLDKVVAVPEADPYFYVNPETQEFLECLAARAENEGAINVLFSGDPGNGKTSLAKELAARKGMRFYAFDCGNIRQVNDWWGYRELEGDKTVFYPSALAHALSVGNAVVVLDEINRTPSHLMNPVLSILDFRRQAYVDALRQFVKVGAGTVIVGTINIGTSFAGTFKLDAALRDRFGADLNLQMPPENALEQIIRSKTGASKEIAAKLVKTQQAIQRAKSGSGGLSTKVGMRMLLESGLWIQAGYPPSKACRVAISNHFSEDGGSNSDRYAVEQAILGIFGSDS
jgi:MoxR-like ATPase